MCHSLIGNSSFYSFLLKIDGELAEEAKANGCQQCGGVLHHSDYARKPRGGPEVGEDCCKRTSFCCAEEGCRKRTTPMSVRFFGRKVYWGAVVILATAMQHGIKAWRLDPLRDLFGASVRTLKRWRTWWLKDFVESDFWRMGRGRFSRPVDAVTQPLSLLEAFDWPNGGREALVQVLRFLIPITTKTALGALAI